jgi:hypothetical protein
MLLDELFSISNILQHFPQVAALVRPVERALEVLLFNAVLEIRIRSLKALL